MAELALDAFNGTRSTIIDQVNQTFQTPATANGTLIIGTARKGSKKQIVRAEDSKIEELFGTVPSDPSFEINLVKSYYEVRGATSNGADAFLFRVGDSKAATLNLYEAQNVPGSTYASSGDLSITPDTVNNALTFSLLNTALIEGPEANNGKIEVSDESGVPKSISFTTPDGVTKTFSLDPFGTQPGALYNVRDVAVAFNSDSDWSKWYVTNYSVLRQTDLAVTVQEDSVSKVRYIEVDGGSESFGDKLETLEKVSINNPAVEATIPQGTTTYSLTSIPTKDNSDVTTTITTFIRNIKDETTFRVSAAEVGSTTKTVTLFMGRANARWDQNLGVVFTTNTSSDYYDNFKLEIVKPNGSRIEVAKTEYLVNASGQLVISLTSGTFQIGDAFVATYRYQAFFKEANVRSLIEVGNEFSYFIKGPQIIFGAPLSVKTDIVYPSKQVFARSDINVTDAKNIIINFINPLNRPDVGASVLVTYTYLPELPATSSAVLDLPTSGQVIQRSGFSGGDDGRNPDKLRYKELVAEALDLVELYPFKQILVAGAYIDDIVDGYDDETGLPAVVAVDWASMLVPKINRRSNLVKECYTHLAVRPPATFTPESIATWFKRCLENDSTDPGRPANQIDAISSLPGAFRVNVIAGAPLVSIAGVLGGTRYVAYPATIYAGMKQDLPLEISATNQLLPGVVQDLGVKVLNAEKIGGMNLKKYTFMTVDSAGNKIIADAPTCAQNGSQYDRQFVVDAVYAAIDVTRNTSARFIGLARSPENLLAMKNKCQKNVQYLVPKVFQDIQISIIDIPEGSITGRVKLGLNMITSREIRRVDTETRISLV